MSKRSAETLVDMAIASPDELRADPEAFLKRLSEKAIKATPRALEGDRIIYRIIVGTFCAQIFVVSCGWLLMTGYYGWAMELPQGLVALASSIGGSLCTLLVQQTTK